MPLRMRVHDREHIGMALRGLKKLPAVISQTPCTPEERLLRIESLGQRIAGYILFMCEPGSRKGSSAEAKERALEGFYEELIVVERSLGRIKEEFQLE